MTLQGSNRPNPGRGTAHKPSAVRRLGERAHMEGVAAQHRGPGLGTASWDFNTTSQGGPDPRAGNADANGREVKVMAQ